MKPTQDDVERARTLIGTWLRDRDPKGLTDRCAQALADARERERESCAEVCDVIADRMHEKRFDVIEAGCVKCAAAIRARGAEKEE